ncbi:MAG TPA: hypothetical protein VNQ90_11975 [Chthoniobacteraceae bacterium]|nr:hypothetical protein [Chthoniobacteraceae bacterium]
MNHIDGVSPGRRMEPGDPIGMPDAAFSFVAVSGNYGFGALGERRSVRSTVSALRMSTFRNNFDFPEA